MQLARGDYAVPEPIPDPAGGGAVHMELARVRQVGGSPLLSRRQAANDRADLHSLKHNA